MPPSSYTSVLVSRVLFFLQENTHERSLRRLGYAALVFWIITRVIFVTKIYYYRRPHKIIITGHPTIFGKLISALHGVMDTPGTVLQEYRKVAASEPHILKLRVALEILQFADLIKNKEKAFAIPTLSNYHVYVSNPDQIRDLNLASGRQLSFNSVITDIVYPKYTMYGYKFDPEDPHNTWSVSTLSGFRSNLLIMRPKFEKIIEDTFQAAVAQPTQASGDGWTSISVPLFTRRVGCNLNLHMILGEDSSKNLKIVKASYDYLRDTIVTMEVLQRIPSLFHFFVGRLMMRWSGAESFLVQYIENLIKTRLSQASDWKDGRSRKPVDLVQWMLDSPRKDPDATMLSLIQRTIGFIFGSSSQMPMFMAFVLYCLCKYPQYLQPLRTEIASSTSVQLYGTAKGNTPLLDSFLKEVARLYPLQSGSLDRKVLTPFTFTDGTHVPAQNYIRVPQQALMLDPQYYPNPTKFDGFRFVHVRDNLTTESHTRLSHPSHIFPFWGSVAHACPGRFYATMMVKMMVGHVLMNYDMKLYDENLSPTFWWGTNVVPNPWMRILIRPRKGVA